MNRYKIILTFILCILTFQIFAFSKPPTIRLSEDMYLKDNSFIFFNNPFTLSKGRIPPYLLAKKLKIESKVELDPINNLVLITPMLDNKYEIGPTVAITFSEFGDNIYSEDFGSEFTKKMKELLGKKDRSESSGLIPEFVIKLPKSIVGKKRGSRTAGRLRLDGNQSLSFEGKSTKREENKKTKDNTDFDLKMKQELNLTLKGTIGEKIHVNVKHRSSTDAFSGEPNTIEIEYEGDEDEIVQLIQGGNINLSLSGSQYISASASSKGLFGVKTVMKIGNLDITAIASKEEAQKNTKSVKNDSGNVEEKRPDDYEDSRLFYVVKPDELYVLDTESEYVGWQNNKIQTDPETADWLIKDPGILPDEGNPDDLQVFIDNHDPTDDYTLNIIKGVDMLSPGTSPIYNFERLVNLTDYVFQDGIIRLASNRRIEDRYTLAVIYKAQNGEKVGNDNLDTYEVKILHKSSQSETDESWDYTVRNTYYLGMTNIPEEDFRIDIYTDKNNPNYSPPDSIALGVEYIDYFAIDPNRDGVFDYSDDTTIDFVNGYLRFPFIEPFIAFSDRLIYEANVSSSDLNDAMTIYLKIKGKIQSDVIELRQMNILPGTVKVRADGTLLTENTDYIVDYDFGKVTLTSTKIRPDSDIEVDFEYKPLFAVESKTLMGLRADYKINENSNLGATFVYHSEKISDKRPRIGNENRTIIMADIDGELKFDPPFMTKMVDLLPLIKTDEDSELKLSGEIAVSLPSIYGNDGKKEAYVDDMESSLELFTLGTGSLMWVPSSKPYNNFGLTWNRPKAKINWYNLETDQQFLGQDVYGSSDLSDEEKKEKISALSMRITPQVNVNGMNSQSWAGLMRYIGNNIDLSERKYIEVLARVSDTPGTNYKPEVTMHIDIGDINEDYYTEFGGENILNREDGSYNGIIDGIFDDDEDVGLDGVLDGISDDPTDDYSDIEEVNDDPYGAKEYWYYPNINGTEENGELDTEDLNNDGQLNTLDRYFEYSVNLLDSNSDHFVEELGSNWYLFRIPIDDYDFVVQSGTTLPELNKISYARIWFDVSDTSYIHIATLDVVGNKWEERSVRDYLEGTPTDDPDEKISVEMVDNKKNAHYTSPSGTFETEDGEETLEQSIAVNYYNLMPGNYGQVRQKFLDEYDLLSYNKIKFWVYAELNEGEVSTLTSDNQEILIRMGADSTKYYEIRYPIEAEEYVTKISRSNWHEIEVDFSDITYLGVSDTTTYDVYKGDQRYTLSIKGTPSLTDIREIRLGLYVPEDKEMFSGKVYFDDIRVGDPYEDIGYAARSTLTAKFADFSKFTANLEHKTPNFQTTKTKRGSSQSGASEKTDLNISNSYSLGKFFPAELGFDIPLNLKRNYNKGIPRYKKNSDILREDLPEDQKEHEKDESLTRSADISFKMKKTPNTGSKIINTLMNYTIKNIDFNASISKKESITPTNADTTLSKNASGSYKLDINKNKTGLKLWKEYYFYLFPQSFSNSISYKAEYPRRYYWETNDGDTPYWKWKSQTKDTRTITNSHKISYAIFSDITSSYNFSTSRDLMQLGEDGEEVKLFGYNIGQETKRDQDVSLKYNPNYFDKIFSTSFNISANYSDKQKKKNTSATDTLTVYELSGDVSRSFSSDFTLKNQSFLENLAIKMSQKKSQPKKDEEENKNDLDKIDDEENQNVPNIKENNPNSINPLVSFVTLLAGFKNVSISYSNNYSTNYEDRAERPNLMYQLGFPHALDEPGLKEQDVIESKRITDDYSISSGIDLFKVIKLDLSASMNVNRNYRSTGNNKEVSKTFPSARISVNNFQSIIKAEKYMSNSQISSNFNYTEKISGTLPDWGTSDWSAKTKTTTTLSFQPLLSWRANWENNINTDMSYSMNQSETDSHNGKKSETNNTTISGSIDYSFSAESGMKIPLLRRLKFKNELTTELRIKYDTSYASSADNVTKDDVNYEIIPELRYNFTKSINGSVNANYSNKYNKKSEIKIKSFGLNIRIEILF